MDSLPIVDYADLARNKPKFLSDLQAALSDIGFLVLTNYPGLQDDFQQRCFKEVRGFFDAPRDAKVPASIAKTPYFRGWSAAGRGDTGFGQVLEAFQYAFEAEPVAAHDDESVPLHRRLFRGPNTWPDPETFPGFRPAVEELTSVYHRLTHDLGRLTLECLGEDPAHFDQLFNFEDPDLAASLNHNFSLEAIAPHLREKVSASYDALKAPLGVTGAHIDGPPFFALLINDRPGLQVVADEGRWINAPVSCRTAPGDYPVPVIPGSVIVNVGGTLMHLSRGRAVATLHRLNTTMIPYGETRVSMPFFLLPKVEGPLVPFGDAADGQETGISQDRDRGTNAAVNRMGTFPSCTRKWWKKDFERLREKHRQEVDAETEVAYKLAAERAEKKKPSAKL